MKLVQVKIKNFRCYRNESIININDLTALIGKNDAGKSSILEALEIFFNNKAIAVDKDDLNKDSLAVGENHIEITCLFDEIPSGIVIDSAYPTNLQLEYLLNEVGLLEIKKTFNCALTKPKEQTFIVANYPTHEDCNDLHELKNTKLKERAAKIGVPLTSYSATINSSIRNAIWQHIGNVNLARTEIQVDKEDVKKIWDELADWLPVYALFQSDRKSKEDDKEVTDPMKVAVDAALQEVLGELRAIQEKVKEKAIEVAERTLEKLHEMNANLANELKPDFKTDPKWNSIFSLTLSSDKEIPINKRGSGVRRLIVLNFFRAEAERRRHQVNNPSIIYAFEEPETSQHPEHQIKLVDAFKDLATAPNTQIMLTTHTPAIGGLMDNSDLRFVTKDSADNIVVDEGTNAVYDKIAKTLGVLPDPNASTVKLLICVEGPHDIKFLKNISPIVRQLNSTLPDLRNDPRIAFVPLGGGTLKDWVTNNYLAGLGIPQFHIYDRDDPSSPPYQDAANEILALGGKNHAILTLKREMENYIHHDSISRTLGVPFTSFNDFDDIPLLVAQQLHVISGSTNPWNTLPENKVKQKTSKAKKRLNAEVVGQMTIVELQAMDLGSEIASWFQLINDRLL